jgi:hypothetical protein
MLEDDPKFQAEIVEGILTTDPKIQIRIFTHLDQFFEWVKIVMKSGPAAIAEGGEIPSTVTVEPVIQEEHKLVAVISKVEFLGPKQFSLIQKTRDLFIKQKLCTVEDPTAFILTAFEEPNFNIMEYENPNISNVLMKPFDKLILSQHLTFAIDGRHPPSKYIISNQKSNAVIEMLKDVKMDAISDVGFVTKSAQALDGKIRLSKYYGKSFASNIKTSIMAKMLDCKESTVKPGEYICSFSYFGLSPSQIALLKKRLHGHQSDYEFHWEEINQIQERNTRTLGVVLLDDVEQNSIELADYFTKKFSNISVVQYKSYAEMMYDLDPKLADSESSDSPTVGIPSGVLVHFVFDQWGTRIMEILKSSEEAIQLFGKSTEDILLETSWWQHHLGKDNLKKWKDWLSSPKEAVVILEIESKKYYLKPGSIDKDPKTKKIKVAFSELTTEERYQYLVSNSKMPQVVDTILASHRFVQPADNEKWTRVKELFKNRATGKSSDLNTHIMVMASRDYLDQEIYDLATFVTDIFYRPLDRIYLCQKLKFILPELQVAKEPIEIPTLASPEIIQAAVPIQLSEISEAGLIMQYRRSLPPGDFRNFVLRAAYEVGAPRIVATCNFSEPSSEKDLFDNHFVFFGVTDHFLKAARIWIRDNYISTKEKGG